MKVTIEEQKNKLKEFAFSSYAKRNLDNIANKNRIALLHNQMLFIIIYEIALLVILFINKIDNRIIILSTVIAITIAIIMRIIIKCIRRDLISEFLFEISDYASILFNKKYYNLEDYTDKELESAAYDICLEIRDVILHDPNKKFRNNIIDGITNNK